MEENQINNILGNTYTATAAYQRIAILKEFLEHVLYDKGGRQPSAELFDVFVSEHGIESIHAQAIQEWGPKLWSPITAGTFYAVLNALLASLKEVPILTLYTPVKFPPAEMVTLGKRIRTLVGKVLLIDDHLDPTLSIGCAFVLNGIYHEYGLPFFLLRKRMSL